MGGLAWGFGRVAATARAAASRCSGVEHPHAAATRRSTATAGLGSSRVVAATRLIAERGMLKAGVPPKGNTGTSPNGNAGTLPNGKAVTSQAGNGAGAHA